MILEILAATGAAWRTRVAVLAVYDEGAFATGATPMGVMGAFNVIPASVAIFGHCSLLP